MSNTRAKKATQSARPAEVVDIPVAAPEEIPTHEQEALTAEQQLMDRVVLQAQVEYLGRRVAELARENARLKA